MLQLRILAGTAVVLTIAALGGHVGTWAHAGTESLSLRESGATAPFFVWFAGAYFPLSLTAKTMAGARWWAWQGVTLAALASVAITIQLWWIADAVHDDHGPLTAGWGLWTTFAASQSLLVLSGYLAWRIHVETSRRPTPLTPKQPGADEPLTVALAVTWLGIIATIAAAFGPWGLDAGSRIAGMDTTGIVTGVVAFLAGGLAFALYGPPDLAPKLRVFVLPLGAAALTVVLIAVTDASGTSDLDVSWGVWLAVLGASVTTIGGVLLVLVPLPGTGWRQPTGPSAPARSVPAGPPLPPPPTA